MPPMDLNAMDEMLYNFVRNLITQGQIVFEYCTNCFCFQDLPERKRGNILVKFLVLAYVILVLMLAMMWSHLRKTLSFCVMVSE